VRYLRPSASPTAPQTCLDDVGDVLPGAGARERDRARLVAVQRRLVEAGREAHHRVVEPGRDGVLGPLVRVHHAVEVQLPVRERLDAGARTLSGRVERRDDRDVVGQHVRPDAPLLDQPHHHVLHAHRATVDLVQEEDSRPAARLRKLGGRVPDGQAVHDRGDAAQVHRLDLLGAERVHVPVAEQLGDLLDHLGLADAGLAPEAHRALELDRGHHPLDRLLRGRSDHRGLGLVEHLSSPCADQPV
jgi:hypothetical protein